MSTKLLTKKPWHPRLHPQPKRLVTTMSALHPPPKREGDISDTFASLSKNTPPPLPDRFRQLKLDLTRHNPRALTASWNRLLAALRRENELISRSGPSIIPSVPFTPNLASDLGSLRHEIRKRGVAVIRNVIPADEARSYKFEIEEYVRQNPSTRGFPASNPQVWELYWSAAQVRARAHPNLLETQRALMGSLWTASPDAPVSLRTPLSYADRLRIRQPGDAQFALGPHMDGGSVERWETLGYGRGGVYDSVFKGEWEESYDPFDASGRVDAVTDLYGGLGACSMFRMFQGWLSMSQVKPGEGTLQVYPLVKEGLVYTLLRPFFRAKSKEKKDEYLEEENWEFTGGERMESQLHGAAPGCAQEMNEELHPHLELAKTMVNVPEVGPGDYVVWHCDTIHAVDKTHKGRSDSSVLYIPVCPTTQASAQYVARQRDAFLQGTPGPDFPGGKGESQHVGRPTAEYIKQHCSDLGAQTVGLERLIALKDDTPGGKEAVELANKALGF